MKKILHIISDTNIGGGGRSLINYLRYADKLRFDLHVILPVNSALKCQLEPLGVAIYEIDAMADKSMDLKAVGLLNKLIRQIQPDLIHTHGAMAGRLAARMCGRKVVYTKHCMFPLGKVMGSAPGKMVNRMVDSCLSDGVIAISPMVREHLMESGIPEHKIHVLYNGVTPLEKPSWEQRCAQRAEYGFGPDDFVVGILARVEEYKGHKVLFTAVERLIKSGRNVKVLVAGEGSYEQTLRMKALNLPKGNVYFTGFVEDVEKVLWAMDVQINASTESEGTSLSLLEGMSLGLPAIVSDVGGNPLLIRDGENGLVFRRKNANDLSMCILRLMEDPEEMKRMSQRSEEIFREEFTGESFAKHMEEVYDDILKGAKHGTEEG